MIKKLIALIVLLLLLAGGAYAYLLFTAKPVMAYKFTEVKHGDLLASISATGTLEPEEVVDVGAQVAGQILFFGKDPHDSTKFIDYGTDVEEGTVLASIDDALYKADVTMQQANLDQAKASEQHAQADLVQANAKLVEARNNWDRAQKVGPAPRGPLTENDYDAFRSAFESAQAAVTVAQASISQARAGITQAQANLERSQRNLAYCTIQSPVKGTIIDRRVNVGQTVVASLNAPSLFLIAKDLRRIQVWASVNEADVGHIHAGQNVTFSVDAFPGQKFKGTVGKVRLNAQMTQNVVTYTVEINTDNQNGRLLPYLTANVQFEVDRQTNVALVPNAALRWFPQQQEIAPEFREQYATRAGTGGGGGGGRGAGDPAAPGASGRGGANAGAPTAGGQGGAENGGQNAGRRGRGAGDPANALASGEDRPRRQRGQKADYEIGTVWMEDANGYVKPVKVKTGPTDGVNSQLIGDDLKDGDKLVVGEVRQDEAPSGSTNPFAPPPIFGRRRG